MRKKKARHIIEDWLKVLEWPTLPIDNETFEQDELADTIADALDLSAVDRAFIFETIQEMASEKAE
jgi:hypothetical protein